MRADVDFDHWRHYARAWLLHFFGREDAAFDAFATAYRLRPDDVDAARHLAAIAARKKRFDVAERWFVEALRLAPEDANTHFNLGFVREEMGKSREAIEAFGEAVRLKPALDRAWYGMGLARARLGQHAEAAAVFEKAAELQPLNGEAFYQLGMARHHASDRDGVKEVVQRLVGFDLKRARQLVHDAERADLQHLIPELPFPVSASPR
jgi:tetratricopeptide (TPR) repeat protein